ncbi:MAG: holo-ACP synthase [Rhodospirillaceae bacterium]|nr:holo-ACP synthase [Rhodospirillaceae bacterium]|tara:strand:+ start:1257 stop:1697 length:441 start_codon:yes stop_codon:yes gene_type:complete
MIIGIGNDIVDINRIGRLLNKFEHKFVDRVFTEEEKTRATKSSNPAAIFAKRFAAKEAAWKALGDEKQMGIRWKDLKIRNSLSGRPILEMFGAAATRLDLLIPSGMVSRLDLSLSDEPPFAQAFVVISAENKKTNSLRRQAAEHGL